MLGDSIDLGRVENTRFSKDRELLGSLRRYDQRI